MTFGKQMMKIITREKDFDCTSFVGHGRVKNYVNANDVIASMHSLARTRLHQSIHSFTSSSTSLSLHLSLIHHVTYPPSKFTFPNGTDNETRVGLVSISIKGHKLNSDYQSNTF